MLDYRIAGKVYCSSDSMMHGRGPPFASLLIPYCCCLSFFFIFTPTSGQDAGSTTTGGITAPQKVVNFTARFITNFVTGDQVLNLTWMLTNDLIVGASKSDIGDDALGNMTDMLTASQYSKLATMVVCMYPKFGYNKDAIMAALYKAMGAISKVVNSFYLQLVQKVLSMNAAGRGKNAKYLQVCRMLAQFLTQPNICVNMQAVKNNLLENEWSGFRGCVDQSTVHWTNCGM